MQRAYYEPVPDPPSIRVRVNVARRHRNAFETILGGDAELLTTAFAGKSPVGWGLHEPSGMPWNRDELTAFARETGEPMQVIVAGSRDGREATGTVGVHRTVRGVEELTEAIVDLGVEGDAATVERMRSVPAAVTGLSEGMPLFVAAFADPGRADLHRAARLPRPPWPLAVLIGAPAVRALGLDAPGFASRHGGRVLGGRRTPSVLLDLADATPPRSWQRLRTMADELGADRIAAASAPLAAMLFGAPQR